MESLEERFIELFEVWEEARPYISRIVSEDEMRLIVAMQGETLSAEEIAGRLGLPAAEAEAFLRQCDARGVVRMSDSEGAVRYAPCDFYTRLDYFIRFGDWKSLPKEARHALDERYVEKFIERARPSVEMRMRGEEPPEPLHNDAIMLLEEVQEMVEAADLVAVLPCDCRLAGEHCDRPVEVCIWMNDMARYMLDRGYGRRLTSQEAKELLAWADKKDLMHTSDAGWREHGLTAICNCCACDCYPFRAAVALGSKGTWPRSRYIAVRDEEVCTHCGACVRRCHFDAFFFAGGTVEVNGKTRKAVAFDPERCWGCGLCANACPPDAITMRSLQAEPAE